MPEKEGILLQRVSYMSQTLFLFLALFLFYFYHYKVVFGVYL